jgi:hypothetical protein
VKRTLLLGLSLASLALLAAPLVAGTAGEVAFAVAAAAFPVLLMALGALREGPRGGRLGSLRWALPLLAVILGGCLLAMIALAGQVESGPRLFGLPLAAAVQLIGLFGLPTLLVALAYGLGFDRHGVSSDDLERLRSLRAEPPSRADTEEG